MISLLRPYHTRSLTSMKYEQNFSLSYTLNLNILIAMYIILIFLFDKFLIFFSNLHEENLCCLTSYCFWIVSERVLLLQNLNFRFHLFKENKDTQEALNVIAKMLGVQVGDMQFPRLNLLCSVSKPIFSCICLLAFLMDTWV